MRKILNVLLILLFSINVNAQLSIPDDPELAKEALTKKLIIVKEELTEKQIKNYTKEGNLEQKQLENEKYNEKILNLFKKYWTINSEIVSKTEDEVKELKKAKNTEYIYLNIKYITDQQIKKNGVAQINIYYSYYTFTIQTIDKNKSLGMVTSRSDKLNKMEYLFAINTLQYFIKSTSEGNVRKDLEEDASSNAKLLKEKTLLIPYYLTELNIEKIKSIYPYKVEISTESNIVSKIEEKNSNYAYVYINHRWGSCATRFNHFIVDCADNNILLLDKRNSIALGESDKLDKSINTAYEAYIAAETIKDFPNPYSQSLVKEKQLENYVSIIEGKK